MSGPVGTAPARPGRDDTADLSEVRSRRNRTRLVRWLTAGGVVLALLAAAATAWFSPLLKVESVTVTGGGITDPDAVAQEAEAAVLGVPLPQVRTGSLGEELRAANPTAAAVRVAYSGPRSIAVEIEDRVPVIGVADGAAAARYDADGVRIDTVPASQLEADGLPALTVARTADPSAAAVQAAALMAEAGGALPGQVTQLRAEGRSGVLTAVIALEDGDGATAEVVFGDASEAERKARIAGYLLADGARRVDVSAPDAPAAGNAPAEDGS
ncbi:MULTISPECIES: hypothetical protein [Brevibacterium]|uniref:Cell division protein FtsQ n=1 Tax=Brevibacterium salitolerans TaxID=1403566 RepID=A0ABN2X852_9MICO|nr:hypothetical protein [Brevibacterium sp.]